MFPAVNRTYLSRTFVFAVPVALQMLLQSLLGMADIVMVSSIGANAIAAVGLASKLHFLLLVLSVGIATAGSTLIAQYWGAKNLYGGQRTLAVTLVLGVTVNLPLAILFSLAEHWIGLVNPDINVADLAARFLVITAPLLIFTQVTVILEAALRATGNMTVPLVTAALAVVTNIGLNYVFIFGHLGFESMGVMGAAWGTLVARMLQLMVLLSWLYWSKHGFALNFDLFKAALSQKEFVYFSKFASPMVLNYGLWGLGNTTYHVLMGFSGTEALAVMGVMVPIESAFFAFFAGVASACSILIGQALGADNHEEAKRLKQFYLQFILVAVVLASSALWLGQSLLLPIFDHLSPSSLQLLSQAITVFCLVVIIKVLNLLVIVGVLRAGGDNKYCLWVDTIAMWAFGLPIFAFAVWYGYSFLWLYALMALEDMVKIWPFLLRVRKGIWLKNLTMQISSKD